MRHPRPTTCAPWAFAWPTPTAPCHWPPSATGAEPCPSHAGVGACVARAGTGLFAGPHDRGAAGRPRLGLANVSGLVPRPRLALRPAPARRYARPFPGRQRPSGARVGPGSGPALAGGGRGVPEGGLAWRQRGSHLGTGQEGTVAAADGSTSQFAALPRLRPAAVGRGVVPG